jgi:hypothetical protein
MKIFGPLFATVALSCGLYAAADLSVTGGVFRFNATDY